MEAVIKPLRHKIMKTQPQVTPKMRYLVVNRITFFAVCAFIFTSHTPILGALTLQFEEILPLLADEVGRTRPVAVAVDPLSGEICVTDARQAALHIFNRHNIPLYRSNAAARISYPADGCLDQQGRLLCIDRLAGDQHGIRRLNAYGEPDPFTPARPLGSWNPEHLTVTRDGHYLGLDMRHGVLTKHDSTTGALLWQRQVADPGEDDLLMGRPCEAPDSRIYIPGGNLRRMLVLDAEGRLLESFGEFGSAEGYFSLPVAACFSPEGDLLVLDRMRHKILVFDENHGFVSEFGTMGAAPGQFYHPVSMAATADGRIYVAQGFQGRVQVFRLGR